MHEGAGHNGAVRLNAVICTNMSQRNQDRKGAVFYDGPDRML